MPSKVAIVADDHPILLVVMGEILQGAYPDLKVVGLPSFDGVIPAARSADEVALAIFDLKMPGMEGVEGIRRFRREFPATPVAICSASEDRETIRESIEAGACGFLPKTMNHETLIMAVRLILSGGHYVPVQALGGLTELLSVTADPVDAEVPSPAIPNDHLSDREQQVMSLLLEGLSNKLIGRRLKIAEVTVKLHLRNAYRKLGVQTRAAALVKLLAS